MFKCVFVFVVVLFLLIQSQMNWYHSSSASGVIDLEKLSEIEALDSFFKKRGEDSNTIIFVVSSLAHHRHTPVLLVLNSRI